MPITSDQDVKYESENSDEYEEIKDNNLADIPLEIIGASPKQKPQEFAKTVFRFTGI
jgi:hypothetical protein